VLYDNCTVYIINKWIWWTLVFHERQHSHTHTHREKCSCRQNGNQKIRRPKLHVFFSSHFCIIPIAKMIFGRKKHCIYVCMCVCVCVCVGVKERETDREREHALAHACLCGIQPEFFTFFCNENIYCVYCTISNITWSLNSHHNSLKWNCDFLFNLSVLKKPKLTRDTAKCCSYKHINLLPANTSLCYL